MLEAVDKEKAKAKKVLLLQQYSKESQALKIVIELAYDKAWQWLLPEGNPPYNPSPKEADLQHVLKADARRLQYFVNTPQGNAMKPLRRETMFIELLEAVDPLDAKLLLAAKSKKSNAMEALLRAMAFICKDDAEYVAVALSVYSASGGDYNKLGRKAVALRGKDTLVDRLLKQMHAALQ